MIDSKPPQMVNLPTSTVNKNENFIGIQCNAPQTDKNGKKWNYSDMDTLTPKTKADLEFGKCGDCRLCWNSNVKNISYKYH